MMLGSVYVCIVFLFMLTQFDVLKSDGRFPQLWVRHTVACCCCLIGQVAPTFGTSKQGVKSTSYRKYFTFFMIYTDTYMCVHIYIFWYTYIAIYLATKFPSQFDTLIELAPILHHNSECFTLSECLKKCNILTTMFLCNCK